MGLSAQWPRRDSGRIHDGTKRVFVPEMQFETVASAPPLDLAAVKKTETTEARLSVPAKKNKK